MGFEFKKERPTSARTEMDGLKVSWDFDFDAYGDTVFEGYDLWSPEYD